MLNKIFGCFFGKKKFKDKLLNKIIAVFLILFQAVFLLILLDAEIFKVSAQDSANTSSLVYFTSPTETIISGEKLVSVSLSSSIITDDVYLKINDATTYLPMAKQANGAFTYIWNTNTYPNGYHTIQAIANYQGTHINSNILTININNLTTTSETFKIDILDPGPLSMQTSDFIVKVSSNFENIGSIDGKLLTESDILIKHFSLSLKDGYFQFILPITDLADGIYKIHITANLTTAQVANSYVNFKIQKIINDDMAATGTTTETLHETEILDYTNEIPTTTGDDIIPAEIITPASTIVTASALDDTSALSSANLNTIIAPKVNFINQPPIVNNSTIIKATTTFEAEEIIFVVSGPKNANFNGTKENSFLYSFFWDIDADFPEGNYIIKANAKKDGQIYSDELKINYTKNNIIPTENILQKPINFSETSVSENTTGIEQKSQTTATTTTDEEDADLITEECKKIGIVNSDECDIYINLDPLCKNKEIKTLYQCDIYLNLNLKCRELDLDESACNIFLRLPAACQNTNISDQEKCKKFLYVGSLPPICIQNNIDSHEKCNDFLALRALPPACIEAGIKTKEECRTFLSSNSLALECKKAKIAKKAECEIYLSKLKQNQLCAALGINDKDQCLYYFQNKTLTRDCLDLGIKNAPDCNALLIKKYSQKECGDAGIRDKKECAFYIFNKYQTRINCSKFNEWQCQEIIETKFLGDIASKQAMYNELKSELANVTNKKISVSEFESRLNASKNLILLTDKKTNIKIIRLEDKILLSIDETLIQTAPVAIIVDSDGDGMPDDVEKRIGTDANNYDSDNDGYSDGEEAKNNFNPLGQGLLSAVLAPIDLAIANDKILEQPKTSGELSNDLTVDKLADASENNAYLISGQADPGAIITLYLYSDMPLLVTARADEFGNWQYELKESLIDGEHEIYAAINDNTGRIIKKSSPINFFIREAKAVSIQDFVATAPKSSPTKSESMLNFYFIISLIIVFAGVLLFIIFILLHKNKKETDI